MADQSQTETPSGVSEAVAPARFFLVLDGNAVVVSALSGDLDQNGAIEVTMAIYLDARQRLGLCTYAGGVLSDYQPPPPPPGPIYVQKVDIWRRATDDEATALVQLLGTQTVRLQRMFNDATVISSGDEMWPTIQAAVIGLFGAERAAELLAAS